MMIATLGTMTPLSPILSIHGNLVKIDIGALVIEFDIVGFKSFVSEILLQSARLEIDFNKS